mgnify:CR=1 FL=1
MMRSLFSGVSGLRAQQTGMDVIGNNISNVNTPGYKASRVTFADIMSQTIQGAAAPQNGRSGTNPKQVGLGTSVASIDILFGNSSMQSTGNNTDLAIQNNGFFIVTDGSSKYYTRAGNFNFDELNNFGYANTGYRVMGWMADASGSVNTSGQPVPIQITNSTMAAQVSTSLTFNGNLAADMATAPIGKTQSAVQTVYDSLGVGHDVTTTFVKTAANTWLVGTTVPDASGAITNRSYQVTFDTAGKVASVQGVTAAVPTAPLTIPTLQLDPTAGNTTTQYYTVFDGNGAPHYLKTTFTPTTTPNQWTYSYVDMATPDATPQSGTINYAAGAYTGFGPLKVGGSNIAVSITAQNAPAAGAITASSPTYTLGAAGPLGFNTTSGAAPLSITMDFGDLTQTGKTMDVKPPTTDGYASGVLDGKTIDTNGNIIGHFTNSRTQVLGQIALADFDNPGGLTRSGNTMFTESSNSGSPKVGTANTGSRGSINPGNLEMSNVDLAQEFSNMIVTQRAFQANSKIISTTDEMLQELANLKR